MTQNEIFLCLPGCTELPQISSTSTTSIQLFQRSEEFCFGHFFANTEVSESSSSLTQDMLFSFPKCWHHQTVSCCTPHQHRALTSTPVHKHLHCLPGNPKSTSQTLAGITAQCSHFTLPTISKRQKSFSFKRNLKNYYELIICIIN